MGWTVEGGEQEREGEKSEKEQASTVNPAPARRGTCAWEIRQARKSAVRIRGGAFTFKWMNHESDDVPPTVACRNAIHGPVCHRRVSRGGGGPVAAAGPAATAVPATLA